MSAPAGCLTAAAMRDGTAKGDITAAQTVNGALARAHDVNAGPEDLNIFVSLDERYLKQHSAAAATQLADTEPGLLLGVPVALKDLFTVTGMPTTAGSRMDVSDLVECAGNVRDAENMALATATHAAVG